MLKHKFTIFITIFFFSNTIATAQDNFDLQFQGYFPNDTENKVLISLKKVKAKLTGVLKFDADFHTTQLEGYINKEKVFRLYELDADGNRTGTMIKGQIKDRQMVAAYSLSGDVTKFVFPEVYADGSSDSLVQKKRYNEAFAELELEFKTLPAKNIELKYNDFTSPIRVGDSPFLDLEISKVSSYAAPFTIRQRLRYIQKHSYGGKVKFEEGCTGLVVHAYYYSQEGALFNTYMFIYDEFGDFVQAFVLYEAMKKNSPYITTKFSVSQIFAITDFSVDSGEPIKFRIDNKGQFKFLDRD